MDRFINALKGHSGSQDACVAQPRFARVTSVNTQLGTVRVELQPEGVLSGWLPVLSPWVGNGWGLTAALAIGDQVLILPQEGHAEHGVVVGRAWSESATIPDSPVGELWMTHKSGSFIKLMNDGTISIQGDVHVAGDVYDSHGSLAQLRSHYNMHTHSTPQGSTSRPAPQD